MNKNASKMNVIKIAALIHVLQRNIVILMLKYASQSAHLMRIVGLAL